MATEDIANQLALYEEQVRITREAHRADPEDAVVKMQYRLACHQLDQYRTFWRAIDASVDMGSSAYGRQEGVAGRRGGELVHVDRDLLSVPPNEEGNQ